MKILIIGGSGFLGSRILHHFSLKIHEITVITRGIHKIDAKEKYKYIQIDRKKRAKFKSLLMKYEFDWVIDVCAMEHQDTKEIIEIFKNRISHFLHISTDAVYDFAHLEDYSTFPIFESDRQGDLTDSHDYRREKRKCEQLLVQAYEKSNFPVTIIRPTYIYGPNNYKYREKYFFDRIFAKKNLFIPYPGNAYVDLVHVDDVASLCVECLQNPKSIGEIYNASGGELTSGELLAKLVGNIIGIEPNIVYYKDDDLKKARWPENKRLYPFISKGIKCISNQKAIHQLGWIPQIRLREGINQCYKTYMEKGFEEINWKDEEQLFNTILNSQKILQNKNEIQL